MFTFHKPKVFRSANGCCICKAKSSSSRFTDSKKYETLFDRCFRLDEIRTGEICNACVLLVKRFMKLPKGSDRNWGHVVDARSGPGIKSLNRKRQIKEAKERLDKENGSDNDVSSPEKSVANVKRKHVYKRKNPAPVKRKRDPEMPSFLDEAIWKRQRICCGSIFVGRYGEVAVDVTQFSPCDACIPLHYPRLHEKREKLRLEAEEEERLKAEAEAESARKSNLAAAAKLSEESRSNVSDVDEGFFDRPVVSPDSRGSACATPVDSEANVEAEEEDVESVEEEEEEIDDEEVIEDEEEEEEIDDVEEEELDTGGGGGLVVV